MLSSKRRLYSFCFTINFELLKELFYITPKKLSDSLNMKRLSKIVGIFSHWYSRVTEGAIGECTVQKKRPALD